MTPFWPGAALVSALTIAAPVWAQVPMTAEDLNRQELYRLATTTAPLGLIVAEGMRPQPPSPGLLTAVGYGLATGATAISTVLVGPLIY
jgi:hypothetical protein